jgi:hypothetical protein
MVSKEVNKFDEIFCHVRSGRPMGLACNKWCSPSRHTLLTVHRRAPQHIAPHPTHTTPVPGIIKQRKNITTRHTPHATTRHATPRHATRHATPRHATARHATTRHNTPQHATTQRNTTQHNTTQHNTTQHNTTQHNTIKIQILLVFVILTITRLLNSVEQKTAKNVHDAVSPPNPQK